MKKKLILIFTIITLLIFFYGIYLGISFIYYSTNETKTDNKTTNTYASIYKTELEFLDALKEILDEDVYNEILNNKKDTNDSSEYNFYVVPGMESTKTFNLKTLKKEICSSMTPQGIAVMDKYIFISAYCHTHKHNSVIYIIDRKTGKFIKQVVLPSSSHVGGLAYDDVNQKLWVTEYKNKKAYMSSITLNKLENYVLNKPLVYEEEILLKGLKRSSFITYYNNMLIVGNFNLTDRGKLNVYEIENGLVTNEPIYNKNINSKVQGIAINNDFLGLSTSYSINASQLLLFDNSSLDADLTKENATYVYKFPEKLEQIYVYDNKLYMLFESAAFNYRFRSYDVIDRVITFNIENN